jgi:hypothetical protein
MTLPIKTERLVLRRYRYYKSALGRSDAREPLGIANETGPALPPSGGRGQDRGVSFPPVSIQTNGRFRAERWKEVRPDRNC